MQLAEISIRRPVFATVLSLLVLLIGAVSFARLSVREYPKIDEPVVTVSVRYAGASAEVIESQVTKPLEDSIAGIDAVDVITSISRAEQSQISVRFRLEKDADNAAAEVRDRTARVRNRLPLAVDEPVIAKVEADASPVMWLAFSSDTRTPLEVNDLINRIVKPRLQTVTGVADVPIYGERKYAMRVWLDPERMAGYRLTTQDVEDAIRRNNLELPAGRIESQQREFSVTSQTDLKTPAQFSDIVIRTVNGFSVRVRDVARVEEGPASDRSRVRLNGRDAISVGVIRQATANPLELSKGVRELLPRLQQDLPDDVKGKTLKASAILDAIMATIAPHEPLRSSSDARYRQLENRLKESHRAGTRHAVLIEEAHAMPKATLRHLKRFVELEDGFSRLLSVILLGQNELAEKLDPRDPSVREVVQRCEIITLPPLGEHLEDYLRFRLKRFSVDLSKIVTADGLQALRERLSPPVPRGHTERSFLYPLAVHNLLTAAMNLAAENGAPAVSADIVMETKWN